MGLRAWGESLRGKLTQLIQEFAPSDTNGTAVFATLGSGSAEFSGRPVLIKLDMTMFTSAALGAEFAIQIDSGADVVIANREVTFASRHIAVTGHLLITPTPGSHTINLRWRRATGTGSITVDATDQVLLTAVEL